MVKTESAFYALIRKGRRAGLDDYQAIIDHVVDGDTIVVTVPGWANTPFEKMSLRVAGIDTPECSKEHAKCSKELKLGIAAQSFAKTLAKKGDAISFAILGHDKYWRLDANVTLADGRSWSQIMLSGGYARPYAGGKKSNWCAKPAPLPPAA